MAPQTDRRVDKIALITFVAIGLLGLLPPAFIVAIAISPEFREALGHMSSVPATAVKIAAKPVEAPVVMMPEAANYIDIPFVLTEYRNNELNAEEKYKGRLIETKGVADRITLSWAGTPSLSLRPIEASNNPFADNDVRHRQRGGAHIGAWAASHRARPSQGRHSGSVSDRKVRDSEVVVGAAIVEAFRCNRRSTSSRTTVQA